MAMLVSDRRWPQLGWPACGPWQWPTSTHSGWSKYAPNECNMVDGRHLEKSKILISLQQIDRFWRKLAWRCVSTLWNLITNKISRLQKSKWRRRPSWKFEKSQYLRNGRTDFDEICTSYASGPSRHRQPITFHKFENPRWRRSPSWKIEKS